MAERPAVKVQRIGRDKLAMFLPNREAIKAFEHLVDDVATVLPDAVLAGTEAVELAAAAAAALDRAASTSFSISAWPSGGGGGEGPSVGFGGGVGGVGSG